MLRAANMLTGYAKRNEIPAPALAVGSSRVLLILCGLNLLLGYKPDRRSALVCDFPFRIQKFWTVQDQQAKIGEMTNFLKNMAILGLLLGYPEALADESCSLILAVHS